MREALGTFVVILVVSAIIGCDVPGRPAIAEVQSPQATYTVRLSGRPHAPLNPLVYHSVWAEVLKGNTIFIPPQKIHDGDSFDDSFKDEYTGTEWPQESVLRFKSAIAGRNTGTNEITVVNQSVLAVRSLQVKAEDLFLLFDILPGTELRVESTCWLRADLSWVEVRGQWSDGSPIPWKGVNFVLSSNWNDRLRYRITLDAGGAQIAEAAGYSSVLPERR
jgi:hypothetical protein